ncbi:alcohol dehydrogenase catalytic domain-containing protein [Consotaella aegiceratis]|uniref:alcohol dehydrogenase catalytic domain-containing protein n=1 Tax=Consotaella aegiceratis TaxID=3097961 RepID=UPI002F410A47
MGEAPEPGLPAPDEVVVEIHATGICGTDIAILSGAYHARTGVVLGHESAGVVARIGSAVASVGVGDRVVIDPTFHCGFCRMCRTNRPNHCERKDGTEAGVSHDGTFAPSYRCAERFVYRIPDDMDFAAAALAEPLSCALTGVACLDVHLAHRTMVVGGGPLGVLYAWALSTRGLSGTVVERSALRRSVLTGVLPPQWRWASTLEDVLAPYPNDPTPLDIAVDTSGSLTGRLLSLMARGGQVLTIRLKSHPIEVEAGLVADRSLRLIGSIDSLQNSFAAAVDLIASGRIPTGSIVTHRFAPS